MKKSVLERGILLLDKPGDLTSMRCVERAKAILGAWKAGHSGTLDPKVTGLMLIALNEATKAMPVLLGLDKAYEGTMRVHGPFTEGDLVRAAKRFTGRITQGPPRRSAVAREPRERRVHSLEIVSVEGREVRFRTVTQAGTYIRKLCSDLGDSLGTGAHMASLRRTGIGPFSIEEAFTMEQLESQGESCLFSLEQALERVGLAKAVASPGDIGRLRTGMPVDLPNLEGLSLHPTGLFGISDGEGRLVALAREKDGKARPERVFRG